MSFHLAQVNVSRLREPLESELLADFVAALEPINALADGAPGFVWRLQTEDGDATALRVFDDEMMIVNLSVWESIDALADFVYRSDHLSALRRRNEWFHQLRQSLLALWWVPAGHLPSVDDAKARLHHLDEHGPTTEAFTFRTAFPPP